MKDPTSFDRFAVWFLFAGFRVVVMTRLWIAASVVSLAGAAYQWHMGRPVWFVVALLYAGTFAITAATAWACRRHMGRPGL